MTRTRIAPTLREKLTPHRFKGRVWSDFAAVWGRDAARQALAVLAVAEAARHMFPPENWNLPNLRPSQRRLARALARLESVSGRGRGKGRKGK